MPKVSVPEKGFMDDLIFTFVAPKEVAIDDKAEEITTVSIDDDSDESDSDASSVSSNDSSSDDVVPIKVGITLFIYFFLDLSRRLVLRLRLIAKQPPRRPHHGVDLDQKIPLINFLMIAVKSKRKVWRSKKRKQKRKPLNHWSLHLYLPLKLQLIGLVQNAGFQTK